MSTTPPMRIRLTALLAALAGFVDALAYIGLGGYFASFMSGNSTRLATELSAGVWNLVAVAVGLLAAFVMGVTVAALVAPRFGRYGPSVVLLLVTLILTAAAALFPPVQTPALLLLAVAMGAENAAFSTDGHPRVGLTYMTGTLVRLGHHLAAELAGRSRRQALIEDALLWGGFMVGGVMGALAWRTIGPTGLWLAVAVAAAVTLAVAATAAFGPQPEAD